MNVFVTSRIYTSLTGTALLASGQITMRKVDGWQTLAEKANRSMH
jgi:hypothetical protein